LQGAVGAGGDQESRSVDPCLTQSTKWDPAPDHEDQVARPNWRRSDTKHCPADIWGQWLDHLDQAKISAGDDPGLARFELRRALDRGDLAKLPHAIGVLELNPVAQSWLHAVPRRQQEITVDRSGRAEGAVRADETYD